MNLQPVTNCCPYCDASFVAPQSYRQHLEVAHGERPDPVSAQQAVEQLQVVLERTAARYRALLAAHDE